MAFLFDDIACGSQIFCGAGSPICLGIGEAKIRGSVFVEGPQLIGRATEFPWVAGTVMIAPLNNPDAPEPFVPGALCRPAANPFSLIVSGNAGVIGRMDVDELLQCGDDIVAVGNVMSQCGGHVLSAKKDFDIPHPTKDGWRLTHACVEGPEAAVYVRGRVRNKKEIDLPDYWRKLIDPESITVSLTPIGSHQNIIVKRIGDNKIYLQSNGGLPIDCFYHVFAERIDTEKLIPEYPGTIEDYPGDNSQRSIVGYHYDVKEDV
jgi:hypothetical protein